MAIQMTSLISPHINVFNVGNRVWIPEGVQQLNRETNEKELHQPESAIVEFVDGCTIQHIVISYKIGNAQYFSQPDARDLIFLEDRPLQTKDGQLSLWDN
jgi:hypothetical protein